MPRATAEKLAGNRNRYDRGLQILPRFTPQSRYNPADFPDNPCLSRPAFVSALMRSSPRLEAAAWAAPAAAVARERARQRGGVPGARFVRAGVLERGWGPREH